MTEQPRFDPSDPANYDKMDYMDARPLVTNSSVAMPPWLQARADAAARKRSPAGEPAENETPRPKGIEP